MQAAQATLKHYSVGDRASLRGTGASLGRRLTRIFGCWHMQMGRPMTQGTETFRACLSCGARRSFDAARWEMAGSYYYRPASSADLYATARNSSSSARLMPAQKRAPAMKLAA